MSSNKDGINISVLMPTYNCAEYIFDAIKSILNQTYKNFEFLIIDDGSTDNTKEIVLRFNDPRIKYIQKEHTGFADSLNYGLKIAKYDLIARMDADDISLPNRFEAQLSFYNDNSDYKIISCWYGIFSNNRLKYIVKTPTRYPDIKVKLLLHSTICHAPALFEKKTVIEAGGYKDIVFEDYELWLRLVDKVKFTNIPEVFYLQRYRKDSLSRDNIIQKYKIHYNIQEDYYKDLGYFFGIKEKEEMVYRGWREYFYGNKNKARFYWKSSKNCFEDYRLFIAYIISFLPDFLFVPFKEFRTRFRLEYCFKYFNKEYTSLRKTVKEILN